MYAPSEPLTLSHSARIQALILCLKSSSMDQIKSAFDALTAWRPDFGRIENAAEYESAAVFAAELIDALAYAKKIIRAEREGQGD